jgi:hypothetical protein
MPRIEVLVSFRNWRLRRFGEVRALGNVTFYGFKPLTIIVWWY